jgi:rfaE bifunctional protein kinase chain/domain
MALLSCLRRGGSLLAAEVAFALPPAGGGLVEAFRVEDEGMGGAMKKGAGSAHKNRDQRPSLARCRTILEGLADVRVAVVGDLMADVYIHGLPSRVSREAPVLVLRFEKEWMVPGGAGNTIYNACHLGARVSAFGIVGADERGRQLVAVLESGRVEVSGVLEHPAWKTITKVRILAGDEHRTKQQVVRINYEPSMAVSGEWTDRLLACVRERIGRVDALILSDYEYGTIGEEMIGWAGGLQGKLVVADSRTRIERFRGITAVTPNEEETGRALGAVLGGVEDAVGAAGRLRERLGCRAVLLTRGNAGMVLLEKGESPGVIPIWGDEGVTDVSGAGDTVTAVFTLVLAAGGTFPEAAHLANVAAGIVVQKPGVATLTVEEMLEALRGS